MDTRSSLAAKYAALTRSRTPDDPELIACAGALAEARVRIAIETDLPLLTREARFELASQLMNVPLQGREGKESKK